MNTLEFYSFRDPQGILVKHKGRILRLIKKDCEEEFQKLTDSSFFQDLMNKKLIPHTDFMSEAKFLEIIKDLPLIPIQVSDFGACVEHEAVFFPSYPYEWAPEMLHAAAEFTLNLAEKLIDQKLNLKDAHPQNILFQGPNPVFVDCLSFESRDPLNPLWLPYAQFVRSFLIPLIANQSHKTPLDQIYLNRADGITPEEFYSMTSLLQRMCPSIFSLVTLPSLLSCFSSQKIYQARRAASIEVTEFILKRLFKGLQKHLHRWTPKSRKSKWTDYVTKEESYSKQEFQIKAGIVSKLLEKISPKTLLDIGCNTGFFSILASKMHAKVVAIDSDPAVVGNLFREAKRYSYDILPLVVDICRPSPSLGWNNGENLSFLKRAENSFDTVLMLAVLHHMTITSRIPLEEVAALIAKITTCNLIIEFISPDDPLFHQLVRGRLSLYSHLTMDYFEKVFQKHFKIISKEKIGNGSRSIYHLVKTHEDI